VFVLTTLQTFWSLCLRWAISGDVIGQSTDEAFLPLLALSALTAAVPPRLACSIFTILVAAFCLVFLIPFLPA